MARRAALILSTFLVCVGLVVPSGSGSAATGSTDVEPAPVTVEQGEAPEHRPTSGEERRATRLAQDPHQEAAQPVQRIVAERAASVQSEARPVHLTHNGAWTWYSHPRVLETGSQTYLGYVTRGGTVSMMSLRHSDARLQRTTLSPYQLRDDHNVPALLETPDGRIAAFWAGHGRAPVRYRVGTRPGSITSMSGTRTLKGSGLEKANATYVQAFRMRGVSHQYHVLTRRHSDQNWVLTTSKDLVTWTRPVQLFRHSSWSARTWPYVEAVSAGWRQIHFAVTDGHPAQGIDTSLYHFTFDAGTRSMATAAGTPVRRPADARQGTAIYDGESTDGRVRVYDLALRSNGHPAVAFTTLDRNPDTKGYTYKWAARRGSSWQTRTIARQVDYPEGIALDTTDGNRAVVVTRAGAETQVSELSTSDGGVSWRSRPISLQPGTQRTPTTPVGPGGPYGALWLVGDYTSYTDYATGIVGETTGRGPIDLRATWPRNWASGGGVSARITAGIGGPRVQGVKVWLVVGKPGQARRWMHSARTDARGQVHLPINRYYPKGTTVYVHAPAAGQWGVSTSSSQRKGG